MSAVGNFLDEWDVPEDSIPEVVPRTPNRPVPRGPRFWAKVNKNGPVPSHMPHLGACWTWTGIKNSKGYGLFFLGHSHYTAAHRMSWELIRGGKPDHLVCHRCDNPSCVRPSHLFSGTYRDNYNDMVAKGRRRVRGQGKAVSQ